MLCISLNSVQGFNNALIFKTIQEEDINTLQGYVKSKLSTRLESNLNGVNRDVFICFFGGFVNNPEEFEFNTGEERLIQQIAKYIESKVNTPNENAGLPHFQNTQNLNPKKLHTWRKELMETPLGFIFGPDGMGASGKKTKATKKRPNETNLENLKQSLVEAARKKIKKHTGKDYDEESKICFNVHNVDAHIDGDMGIRGKIYCPLCDSDSSVREVKPFYQICNGVGYWITSNYYGHLKRYHPQTASTESDDTNLIPSGNEKTSKKRFSTISMKIEPVLSDRKSFDAKFQEYEDQLYKQMSYQNLKMSNATINNSEKLENFPIQSTSTIESMSKIKICRIAPDNSCLYGAIAHQLFFNKLNSPEHADHKKALREKVVRHINDNFENFASLLKGRVLELETKNEIIDMDEDCRKFVNEKMIDCNCWGGVETIKAISEIYNVNIITVLDDGTCNLTQDIKLENSRTISIVFRNLTTGSGGQSTIKEKNHYDSIAEMDDGTINKFAKSLTEVNQTKQKFTEEIKDCQIHGQIKLIVLDD